MSIKVVKIKNINASHKTKRFVVKGRIKPHPTIKNNSNGNGKQLKAMLFDNTSSIQLVAFDNDCDDIYPQLEVFRLISIENVEVQEIKKIHKITNHKYNLILRSNKIKIKNLNNIEHSIIDYPKYPIFSKDLTTLRPETVVDVFGIFTEIGDVDETRTFRPGKFKVEFSEIRVKFFGVKINKVYDVNLPSIIYSAKLKFYQGNFCLNVSNSSYVEYSPNLLELNMEPQFSRVARYVQIPTENLVQLAVSPSDKNFVRVAEKKWSQDKTIKFIHLYKSHEVLWNTRTSEYKNKRARQIALKQISKEMAIENFGVNEAKAKISSIRYAYCQEVKKVTASKHSGTGTDSIYKPSVPWFNLMDSFLKSHVIQRSSQTNLVPNVVSFTQISSGNVIKNEKRDNKNSETTENKLIDSENCTNTIQTKSPFLNNPMPTTSSTPIRFNKKKKLNPQLLHIDSTVDKLERIAAIATPPKVENAMEVFGKGVALQLNQLPIKQALASQLKIQTMLTKELLKYEESIKSNNKQTKIVHETYTPESRQ